MNSGLAGADLHLLDTIERDVDFQWNHPSRCHVLRSAPYHSILSSPFDFDSTTDSTTEEVDSILQISQLCCFVLTYCWRLDHPYWHFHMHNTE